jgi:hypothetical protein
MNKIPRLPTIWGGAHEYRCGRGKLRVTLAQFGHSFPPPIAVCRALKKSVVQAKGDHIYESQWSYTRELPLDAPQLLLSSLAQHNDSAKFRKGS